MFVYVSIVIDSLFVCNGSVFVAYLSLIEAEMKNTPFCRPHFQMHFFLMNFFIIFFYEFHLRFH